MLMCVYEPLCGPEVGPSRKIQEGLGWPVLQVGIQDKDNIDVIVIILKVPS